MDQHLPVIGYGQDHAKALHLDDRSKGLLIVQPFHLHESLDDQSCLVPQAAIILLLGGKDPFALQGLPSCR